MDENKSSGVLFEVTDADISKAKEVNPGASLFIIDAETDTGETFSGIFRKPDVLTLQKYLSECQGDRDAATRASASFVSTCIVFPTKDVFFEIHKKFPLLPVGIGNELFKGFGSVKSSKKKLI